MAPTPQKPKKGDLIKFQRAFFSIGYTHWAIYVGGGYVVHLTGDSSGASSAIAKGNELAEIKKEKLQVVAGEDKWEVSNYLDNDVGYEPYPGDDIVRRAMKLEGVKRKYNLLVKNCEHFVTLVRYGKAHSQQVEDAAEQEPLFGLMRDLAERHTEHTEVTQRLARRT